MKAEKEPNACALSDEDLEKISGGKKDDELCPAYKMCCNMPGSYNSNDGCYYLSRGQKNNVNILNFYCPKYYG